MDFGFFVCSSISIFSNLSTPPLELQKLKLYPLKTLKKFILLENTPLNHRVPFAVTEPLMYVMASASFDFAWLDLRLDIVDEEGESVMQG